MTEHEITEYPSKREEPSAAGFLQTVNEPGSQQTMSSREIADLCEKEHKHVLRDIRVMLISIYGGDEVDKIVPEKYRNRHSEYIRENANSILNAICKDGPNWGHDKREFKWKRDNRGYVTLFHLNKSLSITLVSGYKVGLRKKIIDRWLQLESQKSNLPDFTNPVVAARAWADEAEARQVAEREVHQLTHIVEEQKSTVEAFDRLAGAQGSVSITDAAKSLQIKPKQLFGYLQGNGWIFKRMGMADYRAHQPRLNSGVLVHKNRTFSRPDGSQLVTTQVRVTPKGLAQLAKQFPSLFGTA